ncbi:hypothetical protein NDU88_001487 [Pleurodeles waltl]|uniref:Uncharacterized protein n=1 Tax=Pleurodeles waltl TaxID=8319 RepID=A0AAV7VWZ5_PLEWA|nr:hypothetical protein NDU88_001487 [Pleurodeles waltl]
MAIASCGSPERPKKRKSTGGRAHSASTLSFSKTEDQEEQDGLGAAEKGEGRAHMGELEQGPEGQSDVVDDIGVTGTQVQEEVGPSTGFLPLDLSLPKGGSSLGKAGEAPGKMKSKSAGRAARRVAKSKVQEVGGWYNTET